MSRSDAWFIALEGGEGCGKSTQAARLAESLDAVLTYEPGNTELGGHLRRLLLGPGSVTFGDRAEALLLAADRAEHVAEVVRPALDDGRHVVSDRFSGSSLAYQGYGRGLPADDVGWLSRWAAGGLEPDLTVLLRVPREVPLERLGEQGDRFEREGEDFHRRVAEGFDAIAAGSPTWVVVDGTGDVEEVAARVHDEVEARLREGRER